MSTKDDIDFRNAARDGDIELMSQLLKKGISVNAENKYGMRPILMACTNGQEAAVEFLIKRGADVNVKSKSGESPLQVASKGGYTRLVEILLKEGAEINAVNAEGASALHLACEASNKEIVKILLQHGADQEIKVNGKSAAELAKDENIKAIFQEVSPLRSSTPNTSQPNLSEVKESPKPQTSQPMTLSSSSSTTTTPLSSRHLLPNENGGEGSVSSESRSKRMEMGTSWPSTPNSFGSPWNPSESSFRKESMTMFYRPVQISNIPMNEEISLSALMNEIRVLREEVHYLREQVNMLSQNIIPPFVCLRINGRSVIYRQDMSTIDKDF